MSLDPTSTVFFLCDVQTQFSPSVHEYDHVVLSANKMVKLAKLLGIHVLCTTQNAKRLGPIHPHIDLDSLGSLHLGTFDKSLFSMLTPQVDAVLNQRPNCTSIVLFGIESHVCILQTALSLFARNTHKVYVVADAVSSANAFEIPIALDRMRTQGAVITTSDSLAFELIRDAAAGIFKPFSQFIKDEKERTKAAGNALLQPKPITKSPM